MRDQTRALAAILPVKGEFRMGGASPAKRLHSGGTEWRVERLRLQGDGRSSYNDGKAAVEELWRSRQKWERRKKICKEIAMIMSHKFLVLRLPPTWTRSDRKNEEIKKDWEERYQVRSRKVAGEQYRPLRCAGLSATTLSRVWGVGVQGGRHTNRNLPSRAMKCSRNESKFSFTPYKAWRVQRVCWRAGCLE